MVNSSNELTNSRHPRSSVQGLAIGVADFGLPNETCISFSTMYAPRKAGRMVWRYERSTTSSFSARPRTCGLLSWVSLLEAKSTRRNSAADTATSGMNHGLRYIAGVSSLV
ncbi:hypothetical protein OGAPHI_006339 [Ogataea philodendri]|uniref:Uncharacterized protein n=1 Tax=Ogataea philodendri TaxID=1378263 RepID=A0A9P8NXX8_9ASCO|nr:uncharacterized protein OGAPHI_006339 [Ogataea philodendri]KAH3661492.1 hypothetical protein OGAPHI_006339 [Ogataea philodendri]